MEFVTLQWRHNVRNGVSNHQPHDCLLNRLFWRRSKKISKLRVTGLCVGNSPVTGEFPAQRASNAGNVSVWWRHHEISLLGERCISYVVSICNQWQTSTVYCFKVTLTFGWYEAQKIDKIWRDSFYHMRFHFSNFCTSQVVIKAQHWSWNNILPHWFVRNRFTICIDGPKLWQNLDDILL